MFLIHCPYCGEDREEEEFHAAGEAHIARPLDPDACSDKEWGDYLYFRRNPRGFFRELWVHAAGCGKYFNIARDTATYEIHGSYRIGESFAVPGESEAASSAGKSVSP